MVEVEVLAGSRSIGGNFVKIKDRDVAVIFDQGVRFDIMNKYYSMHITPQSLQELRALGILPQPEWYDDAEHVYITHMHLDHLGALSNIPKEMTVHLPSMKVYEQQESRWKLSPTWTALLPRKYYVSVEELKPLEEDQNNVMPVPVSHSAYPSYALLYFGRDETILYTGDFRLEGFLTKREYSSIYGCGSLLEFLEDNRDIKVEKLIIEGTNFGSDRFPLPPEDAIKTIRRILSNHSPVIATMHSLDLEYALALLKLASELNIKCYIVSESIAKLMEDSANLPTEPEAIEEYVQNLSFLKKRPIAGTEDRSIYLVSYREIVDFIRSLASHEKLSSNMAAILSEPEPQVEESTEYDIIANWFSRMQINAYRVRVSGHYYPYQLKTILEIIKPKKIIPVHTLNPQYFRSL
jgi:ribonuclease J